MTGALRGTRFRTKTCPFDKVDMDSELATKTCALAKMNHLLGDAFSIEHPAPSPLWEMDCYKELASLPGVFFVVFDNCEYEQDYKHRQDLLTNCPWLAALSRDCETDTDPAQVIEGPLTHQVGALPAPLCACWKPRDPE